MFEKIVRRVPGQTTPGDELVAIVDIIELKLGLSTGQKSLRTRLSELLGGGALSGPSAEVVQDAVRRLAEIEALLRDLGFETARDTSED